MALKRRQAEASKDAAVCFSSISMLELWVEWDVKGMRRANMLGV